MKGLRGIEGAGPRPSRRALGPATLACESRRDASLPDRGEPLRRIRPRVAGYFASELRSSADGAKKYALVTASL